MIQATLFEDVAGGVIVGLVLGGLTMIAWGVRRVLTKVDKNSEHLVDLASEFSGELGKVRGDLAEVRGEVGRVDTRLTDHMAIEEAEARHRTELAGLTQQQLGELRESLGSSIAAVHKRMDEQLVVGWPRRRRRLILTRRE